MSDLLPFQRAGVNTMLRHHNVLLADDMGLGKTVQAIAVMHADPSVRHVLIVCPASLKDMWRDMLHQWGARPVIVSLGYSRTPGKTYRTQRAGNGPSLHAVILNYDIIAAWRTTLDRHRWDMIVCDEAHYLKGETSKRTVAVCGNRKHPGIIARRKLLMTGTPVLNKPIELWPLLHYLDPHEWPRHWDFAQRYCGAYQDHFGWHFDGATHLDELNKRLRANVMIRRTKDEVLRDLPPKVRQIIPIHPGKDAELVASETAMFDQHAAKLAQLQASKDAARASADEIAYKDAVKALRNGWRVAMEQMSGVRHDIALRKVPHVIEHVKLLLDSGAAKVILWSHHHDVTDALHDALTQYGVVMFDGRTPANARQRAVAYFQNDPNCRVFLGGITAAGVGLTLTAASVVVFAEMDWVPANLTQAEDRCHRIGQRDTVLVHHVVYDGSLDARMAKKVLEKQAIIDRVTEAVPNEQAS